MSAKRKIESGTADGGKVKGFRKGQAAEIVVGGYSLIVFRAFVADTVLDSRCAGRFYY